MAQKYEDKYARRTKLWNRWKDDEEVNSGTPHEAILSGDSPPSLQDTIARLVGQHLQAQSDDGHETFDEANDFAEEDADLTDLTPYELNALEDDVTPSIDAPLTHPLTPAESGAESHEETPAEVPMPNSDSVVSTQRGSTGEQDPE